jgi:hypothetical protein
VDAAQAIDAAMDDAELPPVDHAVDAARRRPHGEQLATRDQPVLTGRPPSQLVDRPGCTISAAHGRP